MPRPVQSETQNRSTQNVCMPLEPQRFEMGRAGYKLVGEDGK